MSLTLSKWMNILNAIFKGGSTKKKSFSYKYLIVICIYDYDLPMLSVALALNLEKLYRMVKTFTESSLRFHSQSITIIYRTRYYRPHFGRISFSLQYENETNNFSNIKPMKYIKILQYPLARCT